MDIFGLGDAAKHIGTPQSIAIRNPDCSVATYLISQVRQSLSITEKERREALTKVGFHRRFRLNGSLVTDLSRSKLQK